MYLYERAVKIKYQNNNETAVYNVSNISISHRFLIGQVVKGKHEICYQIGVGLGERDGGMNVHHKASYYLMSDSYKVGSLRLEPGVNYCSSLIPGVTFHLVLSLLVGT